MKSKLKNIRVKLYTAFLLILIIPSIIVSALSYMTAANALEHEIVASAGQNIKLLNMTIHNTLDAKVDDIEKLSEQTADETYKNDGAELKKVLSQYANLHPEALSIYMGSEEGYFIQEPVINDTTTYDPRERDWYKQAMENKGEIFISKPYADAGTDKMVVTISKTVKGETGVIGVDISLDHINKITQQVKIGKEGYVMLLDQDKNFIAHPKEKAGSPAKDDFFNKLYAKDNGVFSYTMDGEDKVMTFITNERTGWKIGGMIHKTEIQEDTAPIYRKTMIVNALSLLVGAVIVMVVIRSILTPIKNMKEKALLISEGDLTQKIDIQSTDEIGKLGEAFNVMQDNLKNLVRNIEQNTEQVAASAEELTASAEQTTSATEHVAEAVQEVAGSADQQMGGLDRNAQALEQMTVGITHIADNSQKVSDLALHTKTQAEIGGQAVSDTVQQMASIHASVTESDAMIRSLSDRSKRVGDILNAITDIAEQTNLLSLNAAIEAARAGEHGKGFAVVADEVRKLAEQSQQSAKEIDSIIQGVQADTESSVTIMARVTEEVQAGMDISKEAIEKFKQILSSTQEITPQMKEVSETAQNVLAAVREVNGTAAELAELAKGNAGASEEVAASTEEQLASMEEITASAKTLSVMAEELQELVSRFKY